MQGPLRPRVGCQLGRASMPRERDSGNYVETESAANKAAQAARDGPSPEADGAASAKNVTPRMSINRMMKVFSVAALIVLAFVALGPASWQPRSGLGFEIDHFVGYFAFTVMFCFAW